jgi:hypothetical protein
MDRIILAGIAGATTYAGYGYITNSYTGEIGTDLLLGALAAVGSLVAMLADDGELMPNE